MDEAGGEYDFGARIRGRDIVLMVELRPCWLRPPTNWGDFQVFLESPDELPVITVHGLPYRPRFTAGEYTLLVVIDEGRYGLVRFGGWQTSRPICSTVYLDAPPAGTFLFTLRVAIRLPVEA